jgi:hypothetical protein
MKNLVGRFAVDLYERGMHVWEICWGKPGGCGCQPAVLTGFGKAVDF